MLPTPAQSLVAIESTTRKRSHNMGVMQNFGGNMLGSFMTPSISGGRRHQLQLALVFLSGRRAGI